MDNIWNNLKLNSAKVGAEFIESNSRIAWLNTHSPVPGVEFRSRGMGLKTYAISQTQRLAMKSASEALEKLYPKAINALLRRRDNELVTSSDNDFQAFIRNGAKVNGHGGEFKLRNNDGVEDKSVVNAFIARDYLDRRIDDALLLSYWDPYAEIDYIFNDVATTKLAMRQNGFWENVLGAQNKNDVVYEEVDSGYSILKSHYIVHCDIAPSVQMQTSKNLVTTTVQGRNFTRKELISGGDYSFSISGSVDSMKPGVYPTEAVKRLNKIATYNGIIQVYHNMFEQLGVKQIIIKDFQLNSQEFKNIQPYTINCVAVETADVELKHTSTVGRINKQIAESESSSWYDMVLNSKFGKNVQANVLDSVESVVNKGLDVNSWSKLI